MIHRLPWVFVCFACWFELLCFVVCLFSTFKSSSIGYLSATVHLSFQCSSAPGYLWRLFLSFRRRWFSRVNHSTGGLNRQGLYTMYWGAPFTGWTVVGWQNYKCTSRYLNVPPDASCFHLKQLLLFLDIYPGPLEYRFGMKCSYQLCV